MIAQNTINGGKNRSIILKDFIMKIYEIHTSNYDAEHILTLKVDGDNIEIISAVDDWDDDVTVAIKEKTKSN